MYFRRVFIHFIYKIIVLGFKDLIVESHNKIQNVINRSKITVIT